jgi:hypothetical protein
MLRACFLLCEASFEPDQSWQLAINKQIIEYSFIHSLMEACFARVAQVPIMTGLRGTILHSADLLTLCKCPYVCY